MYDELDSMIDSSKTIKTLNKVKTKIEISYYEGYITRKEYEKLIDKWYIKVQNTKVYTR